MTKNYLDFLTDWDVEFPEAVAALNEARRDASARAADAIAGLPARTP